MIEKVCMSWIQYYAFAKKIKPSATVISLPQSKLSSCRRGTTHVLQLNQNASYRLARMTKMYVW